MKCPRCHVEVPAVAARCPDCKLPKPKHLIAQDGKNKSKSRTAKGESLYPRKPNRKPEKKVPKWVNILAGVTSALLIAAIGVYVYWYLSHTAREIDPQLAQPAMQKLREMPSQKANLTIDQYMNQELERSRRIGNLVSVQGWTMRPVEGSTSKMLIAFSFQERDNTEQRAEWLADLSGGTFVPQTPLAEAAYRQ